MNPDDIAELTDDERLLLVLCTRQRKAKTGTVRATAEQICQRLGWSHADYESRLGILVDVEAVHVEAHGRIVVPATTAEVVDGHDQLREISSRLARSGAGAHASLEARDFGDSGSSPTPLRGVREHPSPPRLPARGDSRESQQGEGHHARTRRRGEKNWTPYDLANHFAMRVTQFAAHSHVPPGVSNKKALAAQFRAWLNEGWTAPRVRELIDYFAANMGRYVSDGVPVWKSFLARRAMLWSDFVDDQPEVYEETDSDDSEWNLDTA